jgi:hypothetical protein
MAMAAEIAKNLVGSHVNVEENLLALDELEEQYEQ